MITLRNRSTPVRALLSVVDGGVVAEVGPGGEGFLRLSAFAPREACEEACTRLRAALKKEVTA